MEIYELLPRELQNKVKYFVLEHPAANIIQDEIERLNCHLTFKFREKTNGATICKVRSIDFSVTNTFNNVTAKVQAHHRPAMIYFERYFRYHQMTSDYYSNW